MLLLKAASSKLLLASFDLPLDFYFYPSTRAEGEPSPFDLDLFDGVLVQPFNLYFLRSKATSLLTILFSTVDDMSDNGYPRASLIYYLTYRSKKV